MRGSVDVMSIFSSDRFGEAGVRLLKVTRRGQRHEVKDLIVDVAFESVVETAEADGTSLKTFPAGTVKNTLYALAGRHGGDDIEELALALTSHFMLEHESLAETVMTVRERRWEHIRVRGRPRDRAFWRSGDEARVAMVRRARDGLVVEAGIEDLLVLKTDPFDFEGYPRDRYTTAKETDERLISSVLDARWRYGWTEIPFGVHWRQVREVVLTTFAEHDGPTVQHTLHAMAQAVLEQCPPVAEIHFRLLGNNYPLANLSPFGLDNDNEVYVACDEPFDVIEVTVRREESG